MICFEIHQFIKYKYKLETFIHLFCIPTKRDKGRERRVREETKNIDLPFLFGQFWNTYHTFKNLLFAQFLRINTGKIHPCSEIVVTALKSHLLDV